MARVGGRVRPTRRLLGRGAARFTGGAVTAALVLAGTLSLGAPSALASSPSTLSILAGTGTTGAPTTGTATSSDLGQPEAVAVDSSGNVYIADGPESVVEEVTPGGQLSIVAGVVGTYGAPTSGDQGTSTDLGTPDGVAVDSSGDLYISDGGNNEIDEVAPNGTLTIIAGTGTFGAPTAGAATSSDLADPQQIAVDGVGDVFVADAQNDVVEEITAGTLSIVAGEVGVKATSMTSSTSGAAASTPIGEPYGVAVDSSGNLYIADPDNNVVEEVTASSELSVVAGTGTFGVATAGSATDSKLSSPTGVAVDSSGNLYIADNSGQYVEQVTTSGELSILAGTGAAGTPKPGVATNSPLDYPNGVATDNSGDVFLADSLNYLVEEIDTPAPLAPPAPVNVSATPVANGVTVTWTAPSTSQPITSYVVTPYLAGDAQAQNVVPGTTTSAKITGLTGGDSYTFTVVAVNNAGSSPPAASSAVIPIPAPTTTTTPPSAGSTGKSPTVAAGQVRSVGAITRLASLRFRRDEITVSTHCERSCSGVMTITVARQSGRGWRVLLLAKGAFHLGNDAHSTVRLRITSAGRRILAGHVPSWLARTHHYKVTLTTTTKGAATSHHAVFRR